VDSALELGKGVAHALTAAGKTRIFSARRACPSCGRGFPEPDPRLLSFNSSQGWCPGCFGTGVRVTDFESDQTGEEAQWSAERRRRRCRSSPARHCHGARLNPVALHLRFRERSIAELTALPIAQLRVLFERLQLTAREAAIARDALAEIASRLGFLERVGPGLPGARPCRADALGRRGAAHSPGGAAGLEPAGRVLRAR
jgi:excinuclease ABC subunit A